MAKTQNVSISKSNLDPRWDKYSSAATIATSGSFSSNMPKLAQGVVYLQNNNRLIVDIRYKDDKEYDKIVNVIDTSKSKKLTVEFGNEGNVTLTYKNWNKKLSSNKQLILVFASGFRKTITLKIPGTNSKLKNSVDSVTSILTSSPYENMLSVDVDDISSNANQLLVGVYPKADPYDVFNYKGVFAYNLPFAFYINSDSLNEVFVKNGITSSNKNVDKGMSPRGVGHLHPAPKAQEIHFLNVALSNETGIKSNSELASKANSSSYTYGFIYGENLYDIPDDAPEFYVCKSEGDSAYYRTTNKDCDGNTIASKYIDGSSPAKFLDGNCCTLNCDGFSLKLVNTTLANADWGASEGKIKAIVTGGQGDWSYKVENNTTGVSTTVASAESEYEFTGLAFATSNDSPYKVTVTDANACSTIAYIHLSKNVSINDGLLQGCTDSGGLDYDSTADVNTGCLFCLDAGPRGETYKSLSFGMSAATSKALGADLIINESSAVTHATSSGSSSGKISFKGSIFPAALPVINTDTDEAFQFKLYSLGTAEDANNKTKAQVLAISPTTTVASVPDLEHEFSSLAPGWYAVGVAVLNNAPLANCVSVYRFEVKYGGCMDKLADNYDKDATYDNGGCTYVCNEEVITIITKSADNKCVKTVRVNRKKKDENITWKIGSKSKTGPGPHLAKAGDYVHVYVENTKTKCTNTGETFIKEEDCTQSMIKKAYSNSILNTGGCTDTTAFNYDCNALYDNGSCVPVIPGCTDIEAPNYDPTANVDNNSCIDFIEGCLNPTATNYNPLATLHNSEMCNYSYVEIGLVKTGLECPSDPANTIPINNTNSDLIEITLYARGGVTIQLGSTIKAYKLPHNTFSEQGVTLDTLTFPLETSGITPDATWKLTGTDSPFFMSPAPGIGWNGTTGEIQTFMMPNTNFYFSGNFTANSGSVGYGVYVFEVKMIISGKEYFARYVANNPPECNPIYSTSFDGGGGKFPGCTDPNASNYDGLFTYPRSMWPLLHFPAPTSMYLPNGLETIGTDDPVGAATQICQYQLDKICLPPRIDSQIAYLEECIMKGSVNWYNKNITGGKDSCDELALWTMIFIKYLVSKKGLDCIFNCADSGTPNYEPKTCEEKWITGGSKTWTYDSDNYMGNGIYYQGDIVKYDSVFSWQGDTIPNTIWEVINPCANGCGNPYGVKSENWNLCKDDKVFSDTTNYLDKFFKFATKYCKSCQPCSFLPGNEPTVLYNTDSFTYSTETDGTLTIGGIDLEIDGEELEDGNQDTQGGGGSGGISLDPDFNAPQSK
tara:strand:- start:2226 stop:6086 length:3861 start_codon:yes stop_codon:yes gene_type:complete